MASYSWYTRQRNFMSYKYIMKVFGPYSGSIPHCEAIWMNGFLLYTNRKKELLEQQTLLYKFSDSAHLIFRQLTILLIIASMFVDRKSTNKPEDKF